MLHPGICRSFNDGLEAFGKIPGVVRLATASTPADATKTHGTPTVFTTDAENFITRRELHEEIFGPFTLLVTARTFTELETALKALEGQLTATIHATPTDLAEASDLLTILERKAGRVILNSFPTGVEVCAAMNHGGPYPATSDERYTSVGTAAIQRWVRPMCFQGFSADLLPVELRDENPLGIMRLLNNELTRGAVKA